MKVSWQPNQFQSNGTEGGGAVQMASTGFSPNVVEFCGYLNKNTVRNQRTLIDLKKPSQSGEKWKGGCTHNWPHLTRSLRVPGMKSRMWQAHCMGGHNTGTRKTWPTVARQASLWISSHLEKRILHACCRLENPRQRTHTLIRKKNFNLLTFLIKYYKHRCWLGQSLIMAITVHNMLKW